MAEELESLNVVGPVLHRGNYVFLCPVCDDDRLTDIPPAAVRVCTTEWLAGAHLVGDSKLGHRECFCWETDPFQGEEATGKQRRFFYYRTVALRLGAEPGQRVDLPGCTKEKIEQLFGASEVGFRGN